MKYPEERRADYIEYITKKSDKAKKPRKEREYYCLYRDGDQAKMLDEKCGK